MRETVLDIGLRRVNYLLSSHGFLIPDTCCKISHEVMKKDHVEVSTRNP